LPLNRVWNAVMPAIDREFPAACDLIDRLRLLSRSGKRLGMVVAIGRYFREQV
jgi:hypothetical protein